MRVTYYSLPQSLPAREQYRILKAEGYCNRPEPPKELTDEQILKDMQIIGKKRKLEHSQYVWACDDYDMDTTETLYYDEETSRYYLRIEMYHDFITSDGVDRISRMQANEWIRYNKRADYKAPRRRIRQILTFYGKRYYNFRKMIYKHLRKKA